MDERDADANLRRLTAIEVVVLLQSPVDARSSSRKLAPPLLDRGNSAFSRFRLLVSDSIITFFVGAQSVQISGLRFDHRLSSRSHEKRVLAGGYLMSGA
ncbi:hypothetical protein [Rhodococcus sp. Leaf258]|uniref:hypothetical protein n=1 Tax=Rhodococcus sp. Leaf258 TaxID=1736310 RepID=UPI000700D571|nr:hypothetical protein [Rhodococcus sp. Leaf258]KQU28416.1 hypothetical protein ASG69_10405 [Rhodococcus sp. Leaf225]KQU46522.1 hypothetical protein ASH03_07435 [Rhodococcus sp. Leaf258]